MTMSSHAMIKMKVSALGSVSEQQKSLVCVERDIGPASQTWTAQMTQFVVAGVCKITQKWKFIAHFYWSF